jgi:hypothetical protein
MHIVVIESKARWDELVGLAKTYKDWHNIDKWKEPEDYPTIGIISSERMVKRYENLGDFSIEIKYITRNDLLRVLLPAGGKEDDFVSKLIASQYGALEERQV